MGRHLLWVAAALAAALLAAVPARAELKEMEGTVNWTIDFAPPPNAVIVVDLVDIGRDETPLRILSTLTLKPGRDVPVPFRLLFDEALTGAGGNFRLRARMVEGDRVLLRSIEAVRVAPGQRIAFTSAAPEIMLEREAVAEGGANPVGRNWEIERVYDEPTLPFTKANVDFQADGTLRGDSGCNRLQGSYTISPGTLTFEDFSNRIRGCRPNITAQERAIHRAMGETRSWRVNGDSLYLIDAAGSVVMRLRRL